MYQDNPIPASIGENFFRQNRTCPADTLVLAVCRPSLWLIADYLVHLLLIASQPVSHKPKLNYF
jgi:hypothetical protein